MFSNSHSTGTSSEKFLEWFYLHGRELSPEDRKLVYSYIAENKELGRSLMELFIQSELSECTCFSWILTPSNAQHDL